MAGGEDAALFAGLRGRRECRAADVLAFGRGCLHIFSCLSFGLGAKAQSGTPLCLSAFSPCTLCSGPIQLMS